MLVIDQLKVIVRLNHRRSFDQRPYVSNVIWAYFDELCMMKGTVAKE